MSVEAAEAVSLAFAAVKRHLEQEISLKSALYASYQEHGARIRALRLARKMLHLYALGGYQASSLLRKLSRDKLDQDSVILLSLLLCSIQAGLNLGDPKELVDALRRLMGRLWPKGVEPWIGMIRSIQSAELGLQIRPGYQPWFIKLAARVLGRAGARELLRFQDENKPRTYVALNTLLASPERILEEAERSGVRLTPDRRLPGLYVLDHVEDTRGLISLTRRMLLLIQDLSSYYAVHALDPRPGQRILDICAAPGSKTILAGIRMRNRGLIISMDSSTSRLRTHLRRVRGAGLRIVEDVVADATKPLPLNMEADAILLDPPCSSTGLFWREPIYRQMVKPRHIKMFARLQAKMLESSAPHVAKGGHIIYSTCSISLEENELLIEDFLKLHPEFELVDLEPRLGMDGLRGLAEARRLYPHKDYCNGFFIAELRRRW
ncbi:MAG: RsmB/NOP family class I SAM-dependent RNA methyltransferase [Nitrososphaerota archaeon]